MTRIGTGYVEVDADLTPFHRAIDREVDSLQNRFKAVGQNAGRDLSSGIADSDPTGGLRGSMDKTIAKANILGRTIALVKPAAMIASLGIATQAMSAFAAGGVAVVSALAPLAGALAMYPTLLSAYQQGMVVAKLATLGLAGEFEPMMKQLQRPTPAIKAFAKEMSSALLPNLRHVRNIAQAGLLPGVTDGARSAMGVFKYLDPVIAATSKTLGALAREAGALVGSAGFGRDLQTVGKSNANIIAILGRAGLKLADALRHVIVAAGPLTTWMAKLVGSWAEGARAAAASGRESGRMARFFESTRAVMSRLFSITGSLASAFWNVAKAGRGLGNDILASMDKGAASMARWTESAKGQNAIKDFFANAKGPIYETGRLIRDAVVWFGRLSQQPGLEKIIKQIRTEMLPVIGRVIDSTTKAFGPAFITMITAVARAFEPLAGSSGPLVLYVKILTKLADAASWIMRNVPGAATAVTFLVGAFAVSKAIGFAGSITGVTRAIGFMTTAAGSGTVGMNAWAAAAIRAKIAAGFAKVLRGLVVSFWALNAALYANPIVLIGIALIALGAALVYAYKHSETFRRIVDTGFRAVKTAAEFAYNFIKDHWPLLLAIIAGPVGLAVLFVIKHWGTIKAATVAAWNFVRDNIIRPIVQAAVWLYNAGVNIAGFLAARWNNIKSVATTAWNIVKNNIINPIRSAVGWLMNAITNIAGFLAQRWSNIKSAARSAWDFVKDNIVSPIRSAISTVRTTVGNVVGWLGEKWDSVKTKAQSAWDNVKDAITKPVGEAIRWVRGKIGDFVQIGRDIVGGIADGIVSAAKSVLNKLSDLVNKAKRGVKKLLGMSSPSKVFMEIGANISEGMAIGIDRGADAVARSIEALAAIPTLNIPVASGTGTIGGSSTRVTDTATPAAPGSWSFPKPPSRPGAPATGAMTIHVYLGDTEIKDVVKVEIEQDGKRTAQAFAAGTANP